MKIAEINRVCFVGAGTMGCYNALIAALAGYQTTVYDRQQTALDSVTEKLQAISDELSKHTGLDAKVLATACQSINCQSDLKLALTGCELISESVVENLAIKQQVHQQLEQMADPTAIVTTNTSNLRVSEIESGLTSGNRFAALHSYLGAPMFDIVAGPRTDLDIPQILKCYVESLSAYPMVLDKEYPGYVLNAMLGPLLGTALSIVVGGITTRETVDHAWRSSMNGSFGPFQMMDLFGLDLVLDSWHNKVAAGDKSAHAQAVIQFIQKFVSDGATGVKTGRGFYCYDDSNTQSMRPVDPDKLESVQALLFNGVILGACGVALAKVASIEEIDKCWKIGMKLGQGPFHYATETVGIEKVIMTLKGSQQLSASLSLEAMQAIVNFLQALDQAATRD